MDSNRQSRTMSLMDVRNHLLHGRDHVGVREGKVADKVQLHRCIHLMARGQLVDRREQFMGALGLGKSANKDDSHSAIVETRLSLWHADLRMNSQRDY